MLKQVILVPTYLNMSTGKIASQCCWAAEKHGRDVEKRIILRVDGRGKMADCIVDGWLNRGLTVGRIFDEGLTQVAPGSMTAVSIVGEEELVDVITGKMELL